MLVKPRAKKSEVISYNGEILTVKVSAIPHKGASNIELIRVLSKFFLVPTSKITIVSGLKSKYKVINVESSENKLNLALKKLL